jgi:capsular exopolysaccharide synthesis family protein
MTAKEQHDVDLHFLDYWRVIRSRKEIVLAVMLLVVLTGTAYTLMLPKIYMANARISVREDAMDVDVFNRQYVPSYNPFFLKTQYEVIQSRPILYQVIESLNLQQTWSEKLGEEGAALRREDVYLMLASSVKVDQYRDTSLIDIQVYREDPEEASRIANEIAAVYRDQRLGLKRREIMRAVEALQNELKKQQDLVDQSEAELEAIRKQLGVSLIAKGFRADKVRLQQLEADRIAARVDMLVRKSRFDQLESLAGDDLMNASMYVVDDPSLAALRKELIDADVNMKLLLEHYGENHPEVKRVQAGVAELRIKLDKALDGLKKGLKADYEITKAKVEALETELSTARDSDIESQRDRYVPFERAERNAEVQREILNALRTRVAQQGIEMEVPRTPVEVVEPAEPPALNRPVRPKLMLNIAFSLILGLAAGIGLAYFIEYLDTSVKTVDDVEHYLGLTVLGIIPQKVGLLAEEGPDSPHAEVYRVLRTNMQFANKGMKGGAIGFMSGGAGEGKSTTLFNLACVCAQLGDRVLVIDSDLRRPVQHTLLGVSNRFGLTNALMNDIPVEETIKATSIPNLHFIPSGKLPKTALGLLDSQRMRDLIRALRVNYDYVFFDAPPLLGVSDASILASEMDGVLLVVQYRKYPRNISARAKRMLDNVGANVIGVVLNNINILRDDYYYYYHTSPYDTQSEDSKALVEKGAPAPKKEEVV